MIPIRGRRTTAAASGVLLAAGLAAVSASPAVAGQGGGSSGDTCELVNSTITATATVDAARTQAWADYGNSGAGWTGGDSTYSLPLPGGGTGWFFSDTFLGEVNPDGSRPVTAPFVNNSIVVEEDGTFTTVTGGTPEQPDGIIPPTEDGAWHWIGDPTLGKHGTVQIPVLQFAKFGPGQWDWAWTANRLATLDGETLDLESLTELPSETGTNWAAWTQEYGSKTLVYGIRDVDGVRSAFVARVTGNDGLNGNWKYWDGSRWSPREADAVPVASYVSNEFSVAPYRDGYLMVTQDTSELFGTRVVAQVSCSPTGPFTYAADLYRTPETGLWGSYGDPDVFTYNAHEHPEFRDGDTLLVTHNVNTFDNVGDVYDDVTIYRPRFYEVQLTVTP